MSDHYLRFIPEDVDAELNMKALQKICKHKMFKGKAQIFFTDKVLFADAGQNFEKVQCPFCGENITDWWSQSMGEAFSEKVGFGDLNATVPCCGRQTSLNDLKYSFPQGFYRYMIEIMDGDHCSAQEIVLMLNKETSIKWRVIFTHY